MPPDTQCRVRPLTSHPQSRRARTSPARHMFLPPASNPNAKLGFSTYAMWALCVVVVGVCYKLEQNELAARPAGLANVPDEVQKVLPSGSWLMSARHHALGSCRISAHSPHRVVRRGRLYPEGQLNPT